jgi:tetratricopeptide (TPR) repeat protein
LRRIAADRGDWQALARVLAREASACAGDAQVDVFRQIARLWEDQLGNPAVALQSWRKVLDAAPEDREALEHLVGLARSAGDHAAFVDVAQRLLPSMDGADRRRLQAEIGEAFHLHLHKDDEALRFLDAASAGAEPDYGAAALFEKIHEARGQWDLAVEGMRRQARALPGLDGVEPLLRAARRRLESLQDRAGASQLYADVLGRDPENGEALRFQADHLYCAGDLAGAVEVFARMEAGERARDTDDFDTQIEVGLYYFRFAEALRVLGRSEDAVERYEQGLRSNPSHLPSLEALGPLYIQLERWELAGNVYRQVLQLTGGQGEPDRLARTYTALGRVELHQGKLDNARKRFGKALELRPNDIAALQGVAQILFARGEWNELLTVYNNIIYHAQEPGQVVDAYLTKGFVLDAKLNLPDKARQHYEKSLAFDPGQPAAILRLSELALRNQDWAEAVSLAERGLALDVADGATRGGLHLSRAAASGACGDDAACRRAFAEALRSDVTLADSLGADPGPWNDLHAALRGRLQARL